MAHGGKRKGAGRKQGSTNKLKITDHFTSEEIEQLVGVCPRECNYLIL
jgi:hypothetical protein